MFTIHSPFLYPCSVGLGFPQSPARLAFELQQTLYFLPTHWTAITLEPAAKHPGIRFEAVSKIKDFASACFPVHWNRWKTTEVGVKIWIPDAPWCWNIYLQNWAILGVNVTIPAPWSIWELLTIINHLSSLLTIIIWSYMNLYGNYSTSILGSWKSHWWIVCSVCGIPIPPHDASTIAAETWDKCSAAGPWQLSSYSSLQEALG